MVVCQKISSKFFIFSERPIKNMFQSKFSGFQSHPLILNSNLKIATKGKKLSRTIEKKLSESFLPFVANFKIQFKINGWL